MTRTLVAAAAFALVASTAGATTTFESSYLATSSFAQVNGPATDHLTAGTPFAYSMNSSYGDSSATAYYSDTSDDGGASDNESTAFIFNNPGEVDVQFSGEFSINANDMNTSVLAEYDDAATYTFSVDQESKLLLSSITSETSLFYDSFNTVNIDGLCYVCLGGGEVEIKPGLHTLEIGLNGIASLYGPGAQIGSHVDSVAVSISPGPEPSAWILMIAGLAVIGSALRYRHGGGAPAEAQALSA